MYALVTTDVVLPVTRLISPHDRSVEYEFVLDLGENGVFAVQVFARICLYFVQTHDAFRETAKRERLHVYHQ